MKLLFYNHTGQVSGAERVMLTILSGLDRTRFQAAVICPKEGELSGLAQEMGWPVENVKALQARFTWRPDHLVRYLTSFIMVIVKLRKMMIEADPDLIHANTIRAGLVATTATLGTYIPVVWHLHDMLPRHPFSTLIRWYAALSSRTSLLAISYAVARRFRGLVPGLFFTGAKLQVIHNGIDLNRFSIDRSARPNIRSELMIRESQFAIGIIGQITPRKGQLELIRAFACALNRLPDSVLVIVGAPLFNNDHEYLDELERTAKKLGVADRVIFTGARKDIPALMQGMDLMVLNSKVEPFGLVVLEAMACGTPVFAAEVDGVPELIHHGVTGWLVPVNDGKVLAEDLVWLACNAELRNNMAREAIRQTLPQFSAEKFLGLIERFYLRVCMPSTETSAGNCQRKIDLTNIS